MKNKNHIYYPFDAGYHNGEPLLYMDVSNRTQFIREFDLEKCLAALNNKHIHLQKTIKVALERRTRKLQKGDR